MHLVDPSAEVHVDLMVTYSLFGFSFEAGSWADWFSGTMSAAAVSVAVGSYWWSERQRKREQSRRNQKTAHQIGLKLASLANDAMSVHRHLFQPYEGPKLGHPNDPTKYWRQLKPLVGRDDDAVSRLGADEQNLLVEITQVEWLMAFEEALQRHRSVSGSMKEFGIRRQAILEMTPTVKEWAGSIGISEISADDLMRLMPYSIALEHLVVGMRDLSVQNVGLITELCTRYHPMMKAAFPREKFMTLVAPGDPAAPGKGAADYLRELDATTRQ